MQNFFYITVFLASFSILLSCADPILEIDEPSNGEKIANKSVLIKGVIKPWDAELFANGELVIPDKEGKFQYTGYLKDSINTFTFKADFDDRRIDKEVTILRIFTDSEKRERRDMRIAVESEHERKEKRINEILSKTSTESIKAKYLKIIESCYGWEKTTRRGPTEHVFKTNMYEDLMKKKAFHLEIINMILMDMMAISLL